MAGTLIGGRKAAITIKARDPDHFKRIGAIGGRRSSTGGFAADPDRARWAGARGGRASARKPAISDEDFTLIWEFENSLAGVVVRTGYAERTCRNRARKLGLGTKAT